MFRKTSSLIAFLVGIASFLPWSLKAQQVAVATVTGLISDSSGAAVPGATVKMIEIDNSHCLSLGDFNGDLRGTYFMNQQRATRKLPFLDCLRVERLSPVRDPRVLLREGYVITIAHNDG